MNTSFRARTPRLAILVAAAFAVRALPSLAQQATGRAGNFIFKADKITTPGGTLRLEGNGRFYTPDPSTSPQIDISAPLVTADALRAQRVRAQGGVAFKYSGKRRSDTTGVDDVDVIIEARAREVVLDIPSQSTNRTLTLIGDLSGFYDIGGARTNLSGQKAVITFGKGTRDVQANLEGGTQGLKLSLPAQSFGSQISLGEVTLIAARASLNQGANTARLEGGARLSSKGPGKLEISGTAFDAAFGGAEGSRSLQKLSSQGRVSVSFALPPENIGAAAAGTKDESYPLTASSVVIKLVPQPTATPEAPASAIQDAASTSSSTTNAPRSTGEPLKPATRLVPVSINISADSAVVEPNSQKLTLRGNVRGSYVLRQVLESHRPASTGTSASAGTSTGASASGAEEKKSLSLDLDIEGAPVQIELPSFDLQL